MPSSSPSLMSRTVLAILLMIGFYLLATAIAAVLFYIPYAEIVYAGRIHIKLTLVCVVSGGIILWSVLPRFDRFTPPGPLLKPEENPALFAMIRDVARATGQAMPAEVYLCHDLNAWVSQRGGFMGLGSRRVMGLGLPLMQVLTEAQLRAVLAHEFGHFHGGDTKLGPWIWKTRGAIVRTVQGLGDSLVQKPFLLYAKGFLRITHAISRRQEIAADALAAQVAGGPNLAESLRVIHGAGLAFDGYWQNEVIPTLGSGFRPPIAAGFSTFMKVPKIAETLEKHLEKEMSAGTSDSYDTHPCLRERLQSLVGTAVTTAAGGGKSALMLLGNTAEVEPMLLAALAGQEKADKLKAVDWCDVGSKVWLPIWERHLQEGKHDFAGVTVETAARLAADKEALAKRISPPPQGGDIDNRHKAMLQILGSALAVTLAHAGWSITALPGEEVVMTYNGSSVEPFSVFRKITEGEQKEEEWTSFCAANGIASLPLAAAGKPQVNQS